MKTTGKPEPGNGYTAIANELLEAVIIYPFSSAEFKIVLAIIRKTYGYRQKHTSLSYGTLAKLTGIDRRYLRRVVTKLLKDNIIIKNKAKENVNILGLNKYYLTWRLWKNLWITQNNGGREAPSLGSSTPPDRGLQTPKSRGVETPTLNKEINIYKETIKERGHFYPQFFFKNKNENFRKHLKGTIHIKEVITAIT